MSHRRNPATTATRQPVTDWGSIAHELSPRNLQGLEAWRRRVKDLAACVLEDLERGGEVLPLTVHYARDLAAAIRECRAVPECQPLAGGLGRIPKQET